MFHPHSQFFIHFFFVLLGLDFIPAPHSQTLNEPQLPRDSSSSPEINIPVVQHDIEPTSPTHNSVSQMLSQSNLHTFHRSTRVRRPSSRSKDYVCNIVQSDTPQSVPSPCF